MLRPPSRSGCGHRAEVDANDMQGLFAWSPRKVDLGRQVQVFGQLKQEIETFRAIRRGDVRLLEAAFAERRGRGGPPARRRMGRAASMWTGSVESALVSSTALRTALVRESSKPW